MKSLKLLSGACILVFFFFIFPKTSFASTMYLSPGTATIPQANISTIQVRLNTKGEAVNAVSAFLSYPSDKLEVAWINYNSSVFGIQAENTYGGGVIKISRGNISSLTGDMNVATIGFKGKALGNTTVAFTAGSNVPRASDSSNSLDLAGSIGGNYSINPSDDKSSNESDDSLKISEITVSEISSNSATVSWKTNKKSKFYFEYGFDKNRYILNMSNENFEFDHILKIKGPLLIPGANYHFRIKATDENKNEEVSPDHTFRLLGYKIKVKILDKKGKPLSKIPVFLYSDPEKAITDDNGEVFFDKVMPGKHLVVTRVNSLEKSMDVEVKGTSSDFKDRQNFQMILDNYSQNGFDFKSIIAKLMIFVLFPLLIIFTVIKKYKSGSEDNNVKDENHNHITYVNKT